MQHSYPCHGGECNTRYRIDPRLNLHGTQISFVDPILIPHWESLIVPPLTVKLASPSRIRNAKLHSAQEATLYSYLR